MNMDAKGKGRSKIPTAVVLSDDVYAAILADIDSAARDLVSKLQHNSRLLEDDEATTEALAQSFLRVLNVSRDSLGAVEAASRCARITFPDGGAEERPIGLGTQACEALVATSHEALCLLKMKLSISEKAFSLDLSWRRIPPLLRHIALPVHATWRILQAFRRLTPHRRRAAFYELAKRAFTAVVALGSISFVRFFIDALITVCAGHTFCDFIEQSDDLAGCCEQNFHRRTSDREAIVRISVLDKVQDILTRCTSTGRLQAYLSQTMFPLLRHFRLLTPTNAPSLTAQCLEEASKLLEQGPSEAREEADAEFSQSQVTALDSALSSILWLCWGKVGRPEQDVEDRYNAQAVLGNHPAFPVEIAWSSAPVHQALQRFIHSRAASLLPLSFRSIVAILTSVLYHHRLMQLSTRAKPHLNLLFERRHSCLYIMTDDRRKRRCLDWDPPTQRMAEKTRIMRGSTSKLKPDARCKSIAALLRSAYGEPDHEGMRAASYTAKESQTEHGPLLDDMQFRRPPFLARSRPILAMMAVLSEMHLHRAEAECAATLQQMWNGQTACHPYDIASPQNLGLRDRCDDYDCEDLKERRTRREMVADIISERVELAESKAVAQEMEWAALARSRKAASRAATPGDGAPSSDQDAVTWRYEPMLDQWIASTAGAAAGDGDGKEEGSDLDADTLMLAKTPPRASSPDPLIQTSPFAREQEGQQHGDAHGGSQEEDQDQEDSGEFGSEAESLISNLRFTGASPVKTNPYTAVLLKQASASSTGKQRDAAGEASTSAATHHEDHDEDGDGGEHDEMDLFRRRTPIAKRKRRAPKWYNPQEEDLRSKRTTR
ncbi:hypothetical protein OC834_000562 [Tilletia horrida]|nr:hypothetical protein OC834_000562 [Tilletia horrida]